mgnify:CR=1 FL=1
MPDPTQTPLEKAAEAPTVNLRELDRLLTAEPAAAPVGAVQPEHAASEVVPTGEPAPVRTRDAQGRFVTQGEAPAPVAVPPPVVTPPPSVVAAPAAQGVTPAPVPSEPAPKNVADFQKRLAKERWKRGEAERTLATELAALKAEIAALKAPTQPTVQATASTFPTYEAWLERHPDESYEAYLDARLDARVLPRVTATLTAERHRAETAHMTRALDGALAQIHDAGAKAYPDFDTLQEAALEAESIWAPHVTAFVLRHTSTLEEATDLTYRLLKDPDLVERLNGLSPARAHFELGRLLSSVSPAAPPASAVTSPLITQAPAPTVPIGGGSALAPSLESLAKEPQINLRKLAATLGR